MTNTLDHFKATYEDSRQSFRELANTLGGELHSYLIPGQRDAGLSLDSLYLAARSGKSERLLILSSGVHGIEGFTGSALQRYFMDNNFFNARDDGMGILILHGINPYGFKHKLRVTENNVDLNRNFDLSSELFHTQNSGYAKVYPFLNPKKRYSRISFHLAAILNIWKYGMENLRKAILRGQYQFPAGIFFGGNNFEPQVALIQEEVMKRAAGYKKILLVDLHTGYGQRGKLHLFGDRSTFINQQHMQEAFRDLPVDYGQEKDFYAVTGGFTVFLAKLFHEKAKYAGICFEFGTIDSHKTLGSLDSLYRMICGREEQHLFEEMFYPSSSEWRQAVIEQFDKTLKQILVNWKKEGLEVPSEQLVSLRAIIIFAKILFKFF